MDSAFTKLSSDYGLLGIIVVLAICAIIFLYKQVLNANDRLLAEKEKRLEEHTKFFTVQADAQKETLNGATKAIQALLDAYRDRSRQ